MDVRSRYFTPKRLMLVLPLFILAAGAVAFFINNSIYYSHLESSIRNRLLGIPSYKSVEGAHGIWWFPLKSASGKNILHLQETIVTDDYGKRSEETGEILSRMEEGEVSKEELEEFLQGQMKYFSKTYVVEIEEEALLDALILDRLPGKDRLFKALNGKLNSRERYLLFCLLLLQIEENEVTFVTHKRIETCIVLIQRDPVLEKHFKADAKNLPGWITRLAKKIESR